MVVWVRRHATSTRGNGDVPLQHNSSVKLMAWLSRSSNGEIATPPMGYYVLVVEE
jgi:hypothetical protein